MKFSEMMFLLVSIVITAVFGYWVIGNNPDYQLSNVALLKMFNVALLNTVIWAFIVVARGVKESTLDVIWRYGLSRAIFVGFYMLANAWVIGR